MSTWTVGAGNTWWTDTGTVNTFDSVNNFDRWATHFTDPPGAPLFYISDIVGARLRAEISSVTTAGTYTINSGSAAGDCPYLSSTQDVTAAAGGGATADWLFDGLGKGSLWNQTGSWLVYMQILGPAGYGGLFANEQVIDVGGASFVLLAPATITVTPQTFGIEICYTGQVGAGIVEGQYKILRAPDVAGAPGAFVVVASAGAAPNCYTDPAPAGRWWYQVRAYDPVSGITSTGVTQAGASALSNGPPPAARVGNPGSAYLCLGLGIEGGPPDMSCMKPKGSYDITLGGLALPATFPQMIVIDAPSVTADWLKINPGLYNANGTQGVLGIRIYDYDPGVAPNAWTPSSGLTRRPVWVGQSSFPDLIPWGGAPMSMTVEITGITNIPDGSSWDLVIQGFDAS